MSTERIRIAERAVRDQRMAAAAIAPADRAARRGDADARWQGDARWHAGWRWR
ncbi:MAG: hypothetical protein J0I45_07800 [Bosea sp.]|jgi:hypothetical protein|nr:hypothetical protein [Bosea sp. (in: a-proteobacteria)]